MLARSKGEYFKQRIDNRFRFEELDLMCPGDAERARATAVLGQLTTVAVLPVEFS
jgi:hypothetical protein